MFLISSLTSAHMLSPGPSDARQKCTVSLGNRTVTMDSTSSLNCITCSLQSNLKSTRCSSLPRKCVHEEIILVNSRMKIPFRVLSTNHMPPRKWTFYKENHRKKRLLPGEVPPAPQAASGEERALDPEEEARGCSPGFAANSLWKLSTFLPLSPVRPLSLSVPHMPSERRTPKLRVLPASPGCPSWRFALSCCRN